MTQDENDRLLGKMVREVIAKAMPLHYARAIEKYIEVDLAGFGLVMVKFEVRGTEKEVKH
jgi:hypothetical protein